VSYSADYGRGLIDEDRRNGQINEEKMRRGEEREEESKKEEMTREEGTCQNKREE
jgi:hypothetical protein